MFLSYFFFLQMCDKESLSLFFFFCMLQNNSLLVLFSFSAKSVSHSQAVLYTKSMAMTNANGHTYKKTMNSNDNIIEKKNLHRVMMTARCVLYINLFVPRLDRFSILLWFFFVLCNFLSFFFVYVCFFFLL